MTRSRKAAPGAEVGKNMRNTSLWPDGKTPEALKLCATEKAGTAQQIVQALLGSFRRSQRKSCT